MIHQDTSHKENITYTIVSLILYDITLLDIGHWFSDVFDDNTGTWWHCDDDKITQISGFTQIVYTRESHKQNIHKEESYVRQKKSPINGLYQDMQPFSIQICIW